MQPNEKNSTTEFLKRKAKALVKEKGIPHHAALDKVVQDNHGCANWQHYLNTQKSPPTRHDDSLPQVPGSVPVARELLRSIWTTLQAYGHATPVEWLLTHKELNNATSKVLDDLWYVLGGRRGFFGTEWRGSPAPKTEGTKGLRPQPGEQVLTVPQELLFKMLDVLAENSREVPIEWITRGDHNIDTAIRDLRNVLNLKLGGPPMTVDVDVIFEQSIEWIRGGPNDYPYLRETALKSGTRSRRMTNLPPSAVAYSTLRADAPNTGSPGIFLRRVWSFQSDRDPYPGEPEHPNYEFNCPIQGVKPHSIAAGRRSERGRE